MAIVLDTSGLYAALDANDQAHEAVKEILEAERGEVVVPTTIVPEVDYFILKFLDETVESKLLDDLMSGALTLETTSLADLRHAHKLLQKYVGSRMGIVDATVAVIAQRRGIRRILTLDRRHFAPLRDSKGRPFTLLP